MTSYLELMEAFDHYPPELRALIGITLIALLAWAANWMVKKVLLRVLSRVLRMLPVSEGQTAFDDKVVRIVTENGRVLKFTSQGFERE